MEFKNPLTGQTYRDAITQYQDDRDQDSRCCGSRPGLWSISPWIRAGLDDDPAGRESHPLLPLNRGNAGGAGIPFQQMGATRRPTCGERCSGRQPARHRVAIRPPPDGRAQARRQGREEGGHGLPRYHQLDAVRRLEATARADGPGQHYSFNTRPARASPTPSRGRPPAGVPPRRQRQQVFHSVVVITDRRVWTSSSRTPSTSSKQGGVVACIDRDSGQLATTWPRARRSS